jgi:hypothetical protein
LGRTCAKLSQILVTTVLPITSSSSHYYIPLPLIFNTSGPPPSRRKHSSTLSARSPLQESRRLHASLRHHRFLIGKAHAVFTPHLPRSLSHELRLTYRKTSAYSPANFGKRGYVSRIAGCICSKSNTRLERAEHEETDCRILDPYRMMRE